MKMNMNIKTLLALSSVLALCAALVTASPADDAASGSDGGTWYHILNSKGCGWGWVSAAYCEQISASGGSRVQAARGTGEEGNPRVSDLKRQVFEQFRATRGRWKEGRSFSGVNDYGSRFTIRTYYAKGHVLQVYEMGSKSELMRFKSARIDELVPGLRNGMSPKQTEKFMGKPSPKKSGHKHIYYRVEGPGDERGSTAALHFTKGALDSVVIVEEMYTADSQVPRDANKVFAYDTKAPSLFGEPETARKPKPTSGPEAIPAREEEAGDEPVLSSSPAPLPETSRIRKEATITASPPASANYDLDDPAASDRTSRVMTFAAGFCAGVLVSTGVALAAHLILHFRARRHTAPPRPAATPSPDWIMQPEPPAQPPMTTAFIPPPAPEPTPAPELRPIPVPAATAPSVSPAPKPKRFRCGRCKNALPQGAQVCPHCGARLKRKE